MRGRICRALIVAGLSVALLAAAASSASAATISPTSGNFGRILVGKKSAPITFTVTKGSETAFEVRPSVLGFLGQFGGASYSGTTDCPAYPQIELLTASNPSCTITVRFEPSVPGVNRGVVLSDESDGSSPYAPLTGIGMLPRNSYFCRTKNGHPVHKKLWKYCLKKKHPPLH